MLAQETALRGFSKKQKAAKKTNKPVSSSSTSSSSSIPTTDLTVHLPHDDEDEKEEDDDSSEDDTAAVPEPHAGTKRKRSKAAGKGRKGDGVGKQHKRSQNANMSLECTRVCMGERCQRDAEWQSMGNNGKSKDAGGQSNPKGKKVHVWYLIARDLFTNDEHKAIPEATAGAIRREAELKTRKQNGSRAPGVGVTDFLPCEVEFGDRLDNRWRHLRKRFKQWKADVARSGTERHPIPECLAELPEVVQFFESQPDLTYQEGKPPPVDDIDLDPADSRSRSVTPGQSRGLHTPLRGSRRGFAGAFDGIGEALHALAAGVQSQPTPVLKPLAVLVGMVMASGDKQNPRGVLNESEKKFIKDVIKPLARDADEWAAVEAYVQAYQADASIPASQLVYELREHMGLDETKYPFK
jgi:hypothetical protein